MTEQRDPYGSSLCSLCPGICYVSLQFLPLLTVLSPSTDQRYLGKLHGDSPSLPLQSFTNLHMIRKWHSILHTTMLLIGPLTDRKEPLCISLFLWTLPKLHVLSQIEDLYMLA